MIDSEGRHVLCTPSVLYSETAAAAGLDAGANGILTIRQDGWDCDQNGTDRKCWVYTVFNHDHTQIGWGDDIRSPEIADGLDAIGSLVSFLLACAESKSEESENYSLFETPVREWAECYSDELSMIALEIEQEKELNRSRV